jgi:hypothetical protein
MQLIAKMRLALGRGYIVEPGQLFEEPFPRAAQQMIRSGKAFSADMVSGVHYETKIVTPEVKAGAAPFRVVLGGDAEPSALAAVRAAVSRVPDVEVKGACDSVVRRKRGRPRKER